VLDAFAATHPELVRVALPVNGGAGVANQAGLAAATGAWIAKADADDLLVPDRFARQVAALRATGADLCGAAMWEFDEDPAHPVRLRSNPVDHDAIARRMRFNNPVNHPTVVYRRGLALDVGGYPTMRFMQDYDLFARLLAGGARMTNLEEPLVLFRAGDTMRRRRSAKGYLRLELDLQRRLRSYGLIGPATMVRNLAVRWTFRLLPQRLIRATYARFLSTPVTPGGSA
jgi:glycosyltransferase involved in cell wall biosynthesis